MDVSTPTTTTSLRRSLEAETPPILVELRPPRADLDAADSMDAWIDLHHALGRLAGTERHVLVTDSAVGQREEENLTHLLANLPSEVTRDRVVPILTCKHTLDYCTLYAERALAAGLQSLTVVGGDHGVGAPRCVPHAWELRRILQDHVPALELGGWANPHRDAQEQATFLTEDFHADFFLTQIVSHHRGATGIERLVGTLDRRGFELPGIAGVFLYRSPNRTTLDRLATYFPVPVDEVVADFESGLSAEEICARSIRAALDAGARGVYVSNLGLRGAGRRLTRILDALDALDART